jgi:thioredoxin 2
MAATEAKIMKCPACGANNRVPLEKIAGGLEPVCGRCKTPLTVPTHPFTITDANFAAEVERSALPVLLDLWAPWCPPCHMIAPTIEELTSELAGRVKVGKLNIDQNPATTARFNVRSIPTLLVLKNGKEIERLVGAFPKPEIMRKLEAAIR